MATQVDRDDPSPCRQRGQDGGEQLARAEAAVQQDQRLAGAVLLVVQGQSVGVGEWHAPGR